MKIACLDPVLQTTALSGTVWGPALVRILLSIVRGPTSLRVWSLSRAKMSVYGALDFCYGQSSRIAPFHTKTSILRLKRPDGTNLDRQPTCLSQDRPERSFSAGVVIWQGTVRTRGHDCRPVNVLYLAVGCCYCRVLL